MKKTFLAAVLMATVATTSAFAYKNQDVQALADEMKNTMVDVGGYDHYGKRINTSVVKEYSVGKEIDWVDALVHPEVRKAAIAEISRNINASFPESELRVVNPTRMKSDHTKVPSFMRKSIAEVKSAYADLDTVENDSIRHAASKLMGEGKIDNDCIRVYADLGRTNMDPRLLNMTLEKMGGLASSGFFKINLPAVLGKVVRFASQFQSDFASLEEKRPH